jgi:hypothetical protein
VTTFARFFLPLIAALVLISSASATAPKSLALVAPEGLHGFLLQAGDPAPADNTFPRTPSFAWEPVRGAVRYEFQISSASTFRGNGIVYENENVKGATLSVPLSLPWVTGAPYGLFARVRAILSTGGVTPWSQSFGFNMQGAEPTRLSGSPGLLQWTPVDGAAGYQVWLPQVGKVFETPTNVADVREYYTFHQDDAWINAVVWRVRAVRILYGTRTNGLPAVSYGRWSASYTDVNPSFTKGPLQLVAARSEDTVSAASPGAPAHRLMPGFTFTGNQAFDGKEYELYRVYVFTDKDCVNVVFRGAIVGSPAYAPRSTGPLDLPDDAEQIADARDGYLVDGSEGRTSYADGMNIVSTELERIPGNDVDFGGRRTGTDPPGSTSPGTGSGTGSSGSGDEPDSDEDSDSSGGSSSSSSSSGSGSGSGDPSGPATPSTGASAAGGEAGAGTSLPILQTQLGAPVDLPDTEWPGNGYYWTVVPVKPIPMAPVRTAVASAATAGSTTLTVINVTGFAVGDAITIGTGATEETRTVSNVDTPLNRMTLAAPLTFAHPEADAVIGPDGKLEYRDMELPQDVCDKGRVLRFGKESEATVGSSTTPFISGLSSTGRLISAAGKSRSVFYGSPLVAWRPALGADAYEVQWSATSDPFKVVASHYTFATSASLPVTPGTWYYRVRGLNLSLAGSAQRMAWSDVAKLDVGTPTFTVLGRTSTSGSVAKGTKKTTQLARVEVEAEGFSIGVPKGWEVVDQSADSPLLLEAVALVAEQGFFSNMNVVAGAPRGSLSMVQWAAALRAEVATLSIVGGTLTSKIVKLKAGNAVRLTYRLKTADGRQVSITQFAIDGKEAAYVLTYTSATTLAGKYASLFAASANSFTLSS